MHVQGDVMNRRDKLKWLWPGVLSPPPKTFDNLIPTIPMWRIFLATVAGSAAVLALSVLTKSSMAGYGYGAAIFAAISWPYVPALLKSVRWTDATIIQAVLVLFASLAMGDAAQKILGFNPQSHGLDKLNWTVAGRLLWQFPLVLPVENLLLIGAMGFLWKFVRPVSAWQRFGVAILASAFFGLWHVPFWGPWTMWTIGMSVLPWVVYMMATGDVLVPLVAHILMDTMAMVLTFGPHGSVLVHYFWIGLATVLVLMGLSRSAYRDWLRRAG